VNVRYVFNGDRIALAKVYHLAAKDRDQPAIEATVATQE
jgi:hypothetical protein